MTMNAVGTFTHRSIKGGDSDRPSKADHCSPQCTETLANPRDDGSAKSG